MIEPGDRQPVDADAEPPDQDQRLAELVSELADRFAQGEQLELADYLAEYPEFADDLTDLWGTIAVTQAAGGILADTHPRPTHGSSVVSFELPFELGDYRLIDEIGRGGMGIVYRAQRLADGAEVAIKMIIKGDFATPAERKRFEAEAEAAAILDHPNIVPILDHGEHQGLAFFCMPLIRGQTLAQRLASGPISGRQAAEIMLAVCDAIDYAHHQGILHRDLKPSNVLLDENGTPFVADFGLAKRAGAAGSLTRSGAILGTPSYMAPEQAAGARGQVGVATDVYSLGAILYHAITGHPPFLGETPVDTVLMVLEQDPVGPRELNRRVDRDLEMITMRCLQKPQDLRYATAAELAQDLEAWLEGRPIAARDGRVGKVIAQLFRETHNAPILENWGVIWMWHSLVLLVACLLTQLMKELNSPAWAYVLMWTVGFGAWVVVFWWLRRRMGPVTFVERQIAHVWSASLCVVVFMFPLERRLGLEPLALAPMLGVVAGTTFVIKASILTGWFYLHAIILFATAIVMAMVPDYAMVIFGFVSAGCFFFSGLKYYRRRQRNPAR